MTTQKTTQNIGSNNNAPFNPHDYQASSGAISFAALMEVLKAYQDMRNSTAEASTAVTNAKCQAAITQADSTFNSYKADADMLGYQAAEAWGQVASSAIQLGSAAYSGYACSEASKNVDKMDKLVGSVRTGVNTNEFEMHEIAARGPRRSTDETAILNKHRQEILDGFNPDKYTNGLASKLDNNSHLTLKDVFETGTTGGKIKQSELSALNKAITKAQANAHDRYQSKQSEVQRIAGTFNTIGQGAASANSAAVKQTGEAGAAFDKAAAARAQAYAAASKEFSDEVFKSMQSLVDQGVRGADQVFQYMAQMVAQDTRA